MLFFLELAEEEFFGHAYVCHPCDVASPTQLHLKQDGLCGGQAGPLEDFFVWHVVLHIRPRAKVEEKKEAGVERHARSLRGVVVDGRRSGGI